MFKKKKGESCCMLHGKCGTGGGAYCLGFIGALVFYFQHAANLGEGIMGLLKALVWPAMLIYKLLGT